MSTPEGLRALKKRRTRRDIVEATLELSLESGYRATTIPMIAERAMVSPRTVSTYFPNKDEIPFDGSEKVLEGLAERLGEKERPLIERLRFWISDQVHGHDEDLAMLRLRAIRHDPDLRLAEHRELDRLTDMVAAAVGDDVGIDGDAPGPRAFASAFVGILLALRGGRRSDVDDEDARDSGFRFLEAGLRSLRKDLPGRNGRS